MGVLEEDGNATVSNWREMEAWVGRGGHSGEARDAFRRLGTDFSTPSRSVPAMVQCRRHPPRKRRPITTLESSLEGDIYPCGLGRTVAAFEDEKCGLPLGTDPTPHCFDYQALTVDMTSRPTPVVHTAETLIAIPCVARSSLRKHKLTSGLLSLRARDANTARQIRLATA